MRLKIIEALEDKQMMESTRDLIGKLWLKEKNAFYADVVIINFWDVIDTWQKSAVVTMMTINFKTVTFV
jgi:hypothetical protein